VQNNIYTFLAKHFIKNHKDISDTKVREQYGNLTSIVGITVNVVLFAAKFSVGRLSGSVSITGDAVNNLSDAGSSIISLLSFRLSNKPADKTHPFGHARIEYIASSVVAVFIMFIGFELAKTSIEKILHPASVDFSIITVSVMVFSIGAKLWLYRFNSYIGKLINSSMMQATAADSMSDVMATSAVLVSTVISPLIGFQLDGYMGTVVAFLIMIAGIKILRETINSILGQRPSEELVELIETIIDKYDGVLGTHDLVVHDYGPGRCFATVHVEVDANADILESHDLIDNIERDVVENHGIHLVIHMDPIVTDDPFVNEMRELTERVISDIDDSLSIHDFRVVKGVTHSNLVFDLVIPYQYEKSDSQITDEIVNRIKDEDKNLFVFITIDRSFV
jgi:cation diffusion facilitator family transporter